MYVMVVSLRNIGTGRRLDIAQGIFVSIAIYLNQGIVFAEKRNHLSVDRRATSNAKLSSHYIYMGIWLLCAFLLTASYSCKLIAVLTVSKIAKPFNTMEEALDIPDLRIILQRGTAEYNILANATTKLEKRVWERITKYPGSVIEVTCIDEISDKIGESDMNSMIMTKNEEKYGIGENTNTYASIELPMFPTYSLALATT